MGIVTSLFCGSDPARAAASVDPVKALQKGRKSSLERGEACCVGGRTGLRAAVRIALIFSSSKVIFYFGFVLTDYSGVARSEPDVVLSRGLAGAGWVRRSKEPGG